MHIRNTSDDYGLISRLLHWVIAIIMIGLIPIGWYMSGLDDEDIMYWRLLDLHELFGLSLLVLVSLKFIWMFVSPKPPYLPDLKSWERRAAHIVHVFFLFAMAAIPLSGFLFAASDGEPIELYDLIFIPAIGEFSKSTHSTLIDIHYYLSYTCAVLILVHILAALKHHFIDANRTLRRMTF